jgi:hypothetical protein
MRINRYSVLLVSEGKRVLGKMCHWELLDIKSWALRRVKELGKGEICFLYLNDCFSNVRIVYEVNGDSFIKRKEKEYDDTAKFKAIKPRGVLSE